MAGSLRREMAAILRASAIGIHVQESYKIIDLGAEAEAHRGFMNDFAALLLTIATPRTSLVLTFATISIRRSCLG